jgi:cell division protease FtsH
MVAYGDNQDTVFLGREITRNDHVSEDMARKIDAEVHQIIEEQYQRATKLITEKRSALNAIAEALLQYETIEGKHVQEILEFGEIRTPVIMTPPTLKPENKDTAKKSKGTAASSDPITGDSSPEPSPA